MSVRIICWRCEGRSSPPLPPSRELIGSAARAVGSRNPLHVYYTYMAKKLTITISEEVYEGLYRHVGARKISRFLEDLARPHVVDTHLEEAYAEMARDEARAREAEEWTEGLIGDVADETR